MNGLHKGWFGFGLLVWAVATLALRFIGQYIFENGSVVYLAAAGGIVLGFVVLFRIAELYIVKTPVSARSHSALSFAAGGMIGEIPVLYFFDTIMANLRPETIGAYGAFLFTGYTALCLYAAGTSEAD